MLILTRDKGERLVFRDEATGAPVGTIHVLQKSGREVTLGIEGFEGLSILRSEVRPKPIRPISRVRGGGDDAV